MPPNFTAKIAVLIEDATPVNLIATAGSMPSWLTTRTTFSSAVCLVREILKVETEGMSFFAQANRPSSRSVMMIG